MTGQLAGRAAVALKELHNRYEQARLRQQTADKAMGAPAPKVATGSAKGGKSKAMAKTAEKKADHGAARREFVQDIVAGVEFDTLLWHPALLMTGGAAQLAFDVPATAGSYRVLLFGNSADGRLGFYEGRLEIQPDLAR